MDGQAEKNCYQLCSNFSLRERMKEELTLLIVAILSTKRLEERKVTFKLRCAEFQIQTRNYNQASR